MPSVEVLAEWNLQVNVKSCLVSMIFVCQLELLIRTYIASAQLQARHLAVLYRKDPCIKVHLY